MGPTEVSEPSSTDPHDKILESVKAQVKAIMEESVTRKFVHEESEHVLRLCITIHACLLAHLRKRTAGFLRSNNTASLFNKVGRSLPDIARLVTKIEDTLLSIESQLSQNGKKEKSQALQHRHLKHIWVKLALTEKKLDKILEFLVDNSKKFYEKESIFRDPVRGKILSSLLVGPCALEYTKMKTSDHYWSDPPADELLQRHKLHCRREEQSSGRPKLHSLTRYPSMEPSEKTSAVGEAGKNFREYVESLHQNSKSTLLYGKNNVVVQPSDEMKPIHGYLSLHQVLDSLFIKWTPNQLMNVNEQEKSVNCNHDSELTDESGQNDESRRTGTVVPEDGVNDLTHKRPDTFLRRDQSNDNHTGILSFWEYAISVNVKDIVYLHCHQRSDAKGTLVLVGQDGVQRPPICFPPGGHLLAFLACLETGLLPHGQLDPPLWLQRGTGKVFPKLRKRSSQSSNGDGTVDIVEATDFVFRVTSGKTKTITHVPSVEIDPVQENFDAYTIGPGYTCYNSAENTYSSRSSLKVLCDTMRRQIISRAFYGWLAHCRHLSTVRTHLSALILPDIGPLPLEQTSPIDMEAWNSLLQDGKLVDSDTFMKRVYFGGLQHECREYLWPFLLNHYPMNSSQEERDKIDAEALQDYESVTSEWRLAEKLWNQKQKETKYFGDSLTSSTSSLNCPPKQFMHTMRQQSTMSDVFVSLEKDVSGNADSNPSRNSSQDIESGVLQDQVLKKQHSMKERVRGHPPKLVDDHTPYSSLSTEYSSVACRQSSTTVSSSLFEAVEEEGVSVEVKLGAISESQQESDPDRDENGVSENDSESSNRKTTLMKQDRIDMEHELDRGMSQDVKNIDGSSIQQRSSISELSDEVVDNFGININRIEKDVLRCDRNLEYYSNDENLQKMRNIMCSYVWRNLKFGYMQGMCDLAAPLLLLMDDESKVFSCFTQLMKRMEANFPTGNAMDAHFANMRSLLQVLDFELFERMNDRCEYTHFYFCYRWFLLDFKRELSYENDVFAVWETIWAARHVCSDQFMLFFGLALLHNYRDIILDNEMTFVEIIKFFNEMAERHNAGKILKLARGFVYDVQSMISK